MRTEIMHRRAHPLLTVAVLFLMCLLTATLSFAATPRYSDGYNNTGGQPELSNTGGQPERFIPDDPHRSDPGFNDDLMNEGYNEFAGGGGGGGGESIQEIQPSHEPVQSQPSGDSGVGGGGGACGGCGGPC